MGETTVSPSGLHDAASLTDRTSHIRSQKPRNDAHAVAITAFLLSTTSGRALLCQMYFATFWTVVSCTQSFHPLSIEVLVLY